MSDRQRISRVRIGIGLIIGLIPIATYSIYSRMYISMDQLRDALDGADQVKVSVRVGDQEHYLLSFEGQDEVSKVAALLEAKPVGSINTYTLYGQYRFRFYKDGRFIARIVTWREKGKRRLRWEGGEFRWLEDGEWPCVATMTDESEDAFAEWMKAHELPIEKEAWESMMDDLSAIPVKSV